MSIQASTYSACEIIKNHFQQLILILNTHADKLKAKHKDNPEMIQQINEERKEMVNKIEQNMQFQLKRNINIQEKFDKRLNYIINDKTMPYKNKLPSFKKYLMNIGIILLPDNQKLIGVSLILTNGFVDINDVWV